MSTAALWIERLANIQRKAGARIVHLILEELLDSAEVRIIGDPDRADESRPSNLIDLRLPNLFWAALILLKPDLMIGQAYVDGHWSVQPERLYDFLNLIRSRDSSHLRKWFLFSNRFHLVRDTLKQQLFPVRSTRAVVEHYNTDAIFMRMILGDSYSYTCAFFENGNLSLEAAQAAKLHKIVERAAIQPGHRVLDLGTGWGYAPLPLAKEYGCAVTGVTISKPQVDFCNSRKEPSGCSENLQFVCADYSTYEPNSPFDRVISIGMLEHVGKYQYKHFFDKVAQFLTNDGVALVHSIITEQETSPDAWIDRNIFPGGYIPTAHEVVEGIENSGCELQQIYTQPKSYYFRTLELWKKNLFDKRQQCETRLVELGLASADAIKIMRVWEYFLSASQLGFSDHGRCRTAQFVVRRMPRRL